METQQLWISKCDKDEVFKLMKDTIEENITRNISIEL